MNSIRILDRRAGYIVAAFALLVATFIPALAFAAQVTERSIQLSNNSVNAQNVTYKVNFTPTTAAGAFVVDFCSDSPVIGATCTAPAGMDADTVTSPTSGVTFGTNTTSKIVVIKTMDAGTPVEVEIAGINNTSATGPLYARIVTFDNATDAGAYTSAAPGANKRDEGGVAMYISPTIGVTGAVQESLTFCISGGAISQSCTGTSAPTLELGETTGTAKALSSEVVSTGTVHTQISTNAVGGAVISLKSGTSCGGMQRFGATVCDIAPALASGIAAGEAKFGVRTAAATATNEYEFATGALRPYDEGGAGASYNNSTYTLNYLANNNSGVTSTYGDPFLDTNNAPVNNMNMALTFGASINENTPAGTYSTSLSMIATGKF